jgi:hypothetical protein
MRDNGGLELSGLGWLAKGKIAVARQCDVETLASFWRPSRASNPTQPRQVRHISASDSQDRTEHKILDGNFSFFICFKLSSYASTF